MFTPEMMESVKKVEATRASRLGMEPRRTVSYTHLDVYKRQWLYRCHRGGDRSRFVYD